MPKLILRAHVDAHMEMQGWLLRNNAGTRQGAALRLFLLAFARWSGFARWPVSELFGSALDPVL